VLCYSVVPLSKLFYRFHLQVAIKFINDDFLASALFPSDMGKVHLLQFIITFILHKKMVRLPDKKYEHP